MLELEQMLSKNKKLRSKTLLVVIVLVLLAIAGFIWRQHNNSVNRASTPSVAASSVQKNPTAPGASKKPVASSASREGGAKDTSGVAPPPSASSDQWTTSSSGLITVQEPSKNSTLKSGDYLSGTAKLGKVYYRLVDSSVGQIAAGSLGVVNSKFAGKLNFTPSSNGGRLDVFSYSDGGAEINEVRVSVVF